MLLMTAVAACLLAAVGAACVLIVILFGALYDLSVKRNDEMARADALEAEATELQVQLNAALGRLTRKKKAPIEDAERTDRHLERVGGDAA